MNLKIKNAQGGDAGEITLRVQAVEEGKGSQAVHDVVVAYMAAQRSGTACAKTRGEVSRSRKKPWRQKGTGRARHGDTASPIWRGGGVVFGPRPRDYSKKVSKSTRRLALRKALTERIHASEVVVLDALSLEQPKTRDLAALIGNLQIQGTILLVAEGDDRNLFLAARNIPHLDLVRAQDVNTYNLLRNDVVIFTRKALEQFEARLINE